MKLEKHEGLLITPDGKMNWVTKWFIRFWRLLK